MSSLDNAARHAAPWVERLARMGYAAKGVVFVLIGFLTAAAAFRRGRGGSDQADAFHFVVSQPFGRTMLAIIGVGLVGYAVWKIGSAIGDWERKGAEPSGLGARVFAAVVGLVYAGFAIGVFRLLTTAPGGPAGSDTRTRQLTASALELPLGRWLVAAAGLAVVAYGIQQLTAAWTAKLNERLRLDAMSAAARRRVVAISRFGIGARGIVFVIIGASLVSAAISSSAARAQGTAGAMRSIADKPFGQALLIAVALGVVAYGIYAFINARYRAIRAG